MSFEYEIGEQHVLFPYTCHYCHRKYVQPCGISTTLHYIQLSVPGAKDVLALWRSNTGLMKWPVQTIMLGRLSVAAFLVNQGWALQLDARCNNLYWLPDYERLWRGPFRHDAKWCGCIISQHDTGKPIESALSYTRFSLLLAGVVASGRKISTSIFLQQSTER